MKRLFFHHDPPMSAPTRCADISARQLLALVIWALISTGCLSRPALTRQAFALESPAPAAMSSPQGNGVLTIRSFEVSPLFASQSLVYRIGAETYEHDPYAGFIVSPDRALEIPVRAYLRNSGAFRGVAEPGSLLQADRLLEVRVSELYGDLRTPSKPVAVLSMRFIFFQAEKGKPTVPSLDKNYTRRVELQENTAASVVAGWNKALAEIMGEVASELAVVK